MASPPAITLSAPVDAALTRTDLALGLGVALACVAGTWLAGFGGIGIGISAVVGLVLGHIPGLVRPGAAEVRLTLDADAVRWEHVDRGVQVDTRTEPLDQVVDALVLPNEGYGWRIELHLAAPGGRVRIWAPRQPMASADEARRVVDRILEHATNAVPDRLPPMQILR